MKTFIVKENSVNEFLNKYSVMLDGRPRQPYSDGLHFNFADRITIRKDDKIDVGNFVIFELNDNSARTGKSFLTAIKYMVSKYDNVCNELQLIVTDVNVSPVDDQIIF